MNKGTNIHGYPWVRVGTYGRYFPEGISPYAYTPTLFGLDGAITLGQAFTVEEAKEKIREYETKASFWCVGCTEMRSLRKYARTIGAGDWCEECALEQKDARKHFYTRPCKHCGKIRKTECVC